MLLLHYYRSSNEASIKFRDEQKPPLFMGKIPLNILDFPFQSGIVVGDSKSYLSTYRSSSIQVRRSSFMLHFKPRLGDFSIKKSQTSLATSSSSRKEEIRSWRNGVIVNSMPDLNGGLLHAVELLEKPPENGFGAERWLSGSLSFR
ncbi:hypothetical protein LINPERPRIM_LOCUS32420 [Linum perenne]